MSKDKGEVNKDISSLVEGLSIYSNSITIEIEYLKWENPVAVLRFIGTELPSHVEGVRLPHMGTVPVMERERFCWCDSVGTLILYDEEAVPIKDGITILDRYVDEVVQGELTWDEFEDEYLVK
jgi:hypothetical protein